MSMAPTTTGAGKVTPKAPVVGARIIGLDLSLTATGIACPDCGPLVVKVRSRGAERLADLHRDVLHHCRSEGCHGNDQGFSNASTLVVLEGYSYNSKFSHAHALGELGGVVRLALWARGIRYAEVPPATLKLFATGKGNAPKDAVLAAAIRTLGFAGSDNNEADALWLRTMGMARYGSTEIPPSYRPTEYRDKALGSVTWP